MMLHRQRFLVRFWGVRGSYPTPGPHTLRHGGNTSCVEVQVGEHTLVLDAGSGIISLGNELVQRSNDEPLNISMLFSHGHGDHLVGFPFFTPLFKPDATIHFFGPQLGGRNIEQLVTQVMSPPYFPVDIRKLPSHRTFHTIEDGQRIVWKPANPTPLILAGGEKKKRGDEKEREVCVVPRFSRSHPLNGTVMYRIEYAGRCLIYATDVEWGNGFEEGLVEFMEGADVLIHDAQYTMRDYVETKHGFGHSTIEMALAVARAANVGELILFHHEPTYDDDQLDRMEAEARAQFKRTRSACEGMEIDLLARRTK